MIIGVAYTRHGEKIMAKEFAKNLIRKHESQRLRVYDDADGKEIIPGKFVIGHPTIGWGRCLDTKGITINESNDLFENDIIDAEVAIHNIFGMDIFKETEKRIAVLLDMAFNLGEGGLWGFKKMIEAIKIRDWKTAAKEIESSVYFKQVGERAKENQKLLLGE